MTLVRNIKKTALMITALMALGASLVTTPAVAAGYTVDAYAKTANFPNWDRLNIRQWPASHSQKLTQIKRGRTVYVERCIIKSGTDWCKIKKGWKVGWVNGRYLRKGGFTFATPHPWF